MVTNLSEANPTKFQLIFPKFPEETNINDHKQFALNIIDTILPSLTLSVSDTYWKGSKTSFEIGAVEFGSWNTTIKIDNNLKSWSLIADWILAISNNQDNFGKENYKDYSTNASLLILDNFDNKIKELEFTSVFPSELGELKLSYQDGENILTCNVTFMYDVFKIV